MGAFIVIELHVAVFGELVLLNVQFSDDIRIVGQGEVLELHLLLEVFRHLHLRLHAEDNRLDLRHSSCLHVLDNIALSSGVDEDRLNFLEAVAERLRVADHSGVWRLQRELVAVDQASSVVPSLHNRDYGVILNLPKVNANAEAASRRGLERIVDLAWVEIMPYICPDAGDDEVSRQICVNVFAELGFELSDESFRWADGAHLINEFLGHETCSNNVTPGHVVPGPDLLEFRVLAHLIEDGLRRPGRRGCDQRAIGGGQHRVQDVVENDFIVSKEGCLVGQHLVGRVPTQQVR